MSNKIKILFTIGSLSIGGKERQLVEIISNIDKNEYECSLFFKNKKGYYFDIVKYHTNDYYNLNTQKFKIRSIIDLAGYIHFVRPDIIISFDRNTSYFCAILSLIKVFNKAFDFRLLNFSIRDATKPKTFKAKINTIVYNFYNYVIANSHAGLKAYKQTNKKGRFVLHNGLNKKRILDLTKSEARKILTLDSSSFIVSFVAKQDKRKDHLTLFKAIKRNQEYFKNIKFLIIGNGTEEKKNFTYVKNNGLTENVFFWGLRDDIELILTAVDLNILCTTSWHGEGIPNSILESFACSTPVIATNNGGTSEIVNNNINGYLITSGDYISLGEKIKKLYFNKKKLEEFSINAYNTYLEKFTIEKMVLNFNNIINKTLQ